MQYDKQTCFTTVDQVLILYFATSVSFFDTINVWVINKNHNQHPNQASVMKKYKMHSEREKKEG